jgi:hypothetical protein
LCALGFAIYSPFFRAFRKGFEYFGMQAFALP